MSVFTLRAEVAGVLPTPGWAVLFGENDSSLHDLNFYVWIVSDGTTVGLIDAGLPLDDAEAQALGATNQAFGDERGFRRVRKLPEILLEAGVAPESISFVAITQTVTYHSGGIDADLLPNAVFYIAKEGVIEFLSGAPGHPAPAYYFSASSWNDLRRLAIEDRLRLVTGSAQIAPGVRFDVTGGHHPGSAAVVVDTPDGRTAVVETVFLRRNLDSGRPIGIAEDVSAARRAISDYQRDCDVVVAIHEPENERIYHA